MAQRLVRLIVALIVFVVAAYIATLAFGDFDSPPDPVTFINQVTANSFAVILAIAGLAAAIAWFVVEYLQTRRLASLEGQFTTRTFVLMPIAIALNIVLGAAVANALKIPIYLDSIGTILVGALCGPIAGAATGALGNILWSYVLPPPFQSGPAAAFAIVAAVIGIIAGIAGRAGYLRPRPDRPTSQLATAAVITVALIAGLAYLAYLGYEQILGQTSLAPSGDLVFVVLAWIALALVVLTIVGILFLLFLRRDLTASYVVVTGVITGIIAALISAPIAAGVFGGVTGAGTDFLVLAFRQGGADIQAATLGQGLISDPIDKVVTFFVVYLILNAMARRTKARFPQGERLLDGSPEGALA